jgi:hypothetical protein
MKFRLQNMILVMLVDMGAASVNPVDQWEHHFPVVVEIMILHELF